MTRNFLKYFAVVSLLLLAGCVKHISTLRDAQTIFNRAAEADNRQTLSGTLVPVDEASSGYAIAEKMLSDLVAKNKSDLDQDHLLCTAISMRAISLWRLGRLDDARTLATGMDAQSCLQKVSQAPRDVALLLAVPALIRIDEANRIYVEDRIRVDRLAGRVNPENRQRFLEIKEKIVGSSNSVFANRGALCALQNASQQVPDNPVQSYFAMSMLAGLRIVHAATEIDLMPPEPRNSENIEAKQKAAQVLVALRQVLGLEGTGTNTAAAPNAEQSLRGWEQLFGLAAADLNAARAAGRMNFCQ